MSRREKTHTHTGTETFTQTYWPAPLTHFNTSAQIHIAIMASSSLACRFFVSSQHCSLTSREKQFRCIWTYRNVCICVHRFQSNTLRFRILIPCTCAFFVSFVPMRGLYSVQFAVPTYWYLVPFYFKFLSMIFFNDAKSMFMELDAEQNVYCSKKSLLTINLPNIDENKNNLLATIITPVIESSIAHLRILMDCNVQVHTQIKTSWSLNVNRPKIIFLRFFHFCHNISHSTIYSKIIKDEVQTVFSNIEIIIRIFSSLFVTNVPDESAFSKLNMIKTVLHHSMTDEKLNLPSLMPIENEILDYPLDL